MVGDLVGTALVKAGWSAVVVGGLRKTAIFIVVSPVLGFILATLIASLMRTLFRNTRPALANPVFRRLQLLSAAAYSLSHGTNDAQKTMGIIAVLLFSTGHLGTSFHVPIWVILSAHAAIAGVGTARRTSAVRWRLAQSIVWAWISTIPAAAVVAALVWLFLGLFGGH
ncbi:MAG: inorganic phosphate transporter [Dehalococcoidia bacterium]